MAYWVHICDRDRTYLANLPLSDAAKDKVEAFIDYAIAQVSDDFRNDPANRPKPDTPYFRRDFFILDTSGDGRYHHIDFIINDKHAVTGVLLIVFVDHQIV